ncbi:MAG: ABC transporter ATP-binding protein [Dehalococcoidales bacterium]|nr:ABC transporter ATP-binding protein [Dehalococcoidales bacterium]
MKNQDYAIEVKGLTKLYGQFTAVDHVSFQVNKGEFFGFLGPNGAGKTTVIRMLTGIINKNSGESLVMGYPAGSIRAKQLSGVMPELSNAYLDLTAWGNLMLIAELYRVPVNQAKKRAESLLKELGLYERKDSLASTYSMGMRKRLILSTALLPDPEILFLDEPTSGLDVQSVRFMRALLRNLKQEGKTIFLTTHNMDEAAEMCERVAIINHGKIVALDSPDKLSITAGRVYLIDVSFDKSVSPEVLATLPGVNRLETAQAIETADRLRAQQAMAGVGKPGGMGGGQDRMQAQMAGGPPAGTTHPSTTGGPQPRMGRQKIPRTDPIEEKKSDNRFRLYTENTTLLMSSLVDFSRANSLTMNILNVRPPSLEDAFIRLTQEAKND